MHIALMDIAAAASMQAYLDRDLPLESVGVELDTKWRRLFSEEKVFSWLVVYQIKVWLHKRRAASA
jgi:hypothetical protein